MSGASRDVSRTEASIFLAAAKAAPLSRTPDSAFSDISTAGSEACDIENDMGELLTLMNGLPAGADHAHNRMVLQAAVIPWRYLVARSRNIMMTPPDDTIRPDSK
jgi:hypothetical protein